MKLASKNLFKAIWFVLLALCSSIQANEETYLISGFNQVNTLRTAPGPDSWVDQWSHPAPPAVRRAADDLWASVAQEGSAAFDAGWGVGKKMQCGPQRCCLGCLTCGILECIMACSGQYNVFGWNQQWKATHPSQVIVYEQRTSELMRTVANFKEAVNLSVKRPEGYSGDANIPVLGPWVEDGAWHYDHLFVSGRRSLRNVTNSTLAFVNTHGGWIYQEQILDHK